MVYSAPNMADTIVTNTTAPFDSRLMVSADQVTIFGNGTVELPLRAAAGATTFLAQFSNPLSSPTEPRLGNPVVATDDVPTEGITTVRTGSAGQGSPQLPQVIGLLIEVGAVGQDGGTVTVQSSGEVTLTAAQWDLITDGSGGLTQGAIYYLDPNTMEVTQ